MIHRWYNRRNIFKKRVHKVDQWYNSEGWRYAFIWQKTTNSWVQAVSLGPSTVNSSFNLSNWALLFPKDKQPLNKCLFQRFQQTTLDLTPSCQQLNLNGKEAQAFMPERVSLLNNCTKRYWYYYLFKLCSNIFDYSFK